ncbi:Mitochondrial fission process protein 1 [Fusarium keratoplasticum]|uniref:Mitochondrial fission process protein 1 n=1 Tax=Fusarium keratoplasticum TaxID=1328300 RepID=A0ACC0QE86_9HYPO|nr:Mitochondrial fission process protein 1 [Fusarium keratoplasticum]KAI8649076.1 Mitochondrial fission process protein 1 [Fusarium keratoplasticum]
MWWGKRPYKPPEGTSPQRSPLEAKDEPKDPAAFDPHKKPEQKKLPKGLQKIMDEADEEENFYDELVEGYTPPSTEFSVRYAAYATRLRNIPLAAHRYTAYAFGVGESFRPAQHPWLVRGTYGVSFAYILGDVSYEGYKAFRHNQRVLNPQLELTSRQQKATERGEATPTGGPVVAPSSEDRAAAVKPGKIAPLEDYRTVMLQRALFQSIASIGLPAFTIHSIVRYSSRMMKNFKYKTVKIWAPIGLGLSVVPFLPSLFDKPVEDAVEWVFYKGFVAYGGKEAVGEASLIGRERQLSERLKQREREL